MYAIDGQRLHTHDFSVLEFDGDFDAIPTVD